MPKRILIVDDESDLVEVLAILFEAIGYEVATAADGVEAMDLVENFRPDVMLLDVMMPRLNGYEVCRALRERPGCRGIPVLMLSARALEAARHPGTEAGPDAYLSKPFVNAELLAKVRSLVETPA